MAQFIPAILERDREVVFALLANLEGLVSRVHIDFADNSLAPSTTVLPAELDGMQSSCKLDAHLMVERSGQYLTDLTRLGFDRVIFHIESSDSLSESLAQARTLGLVSILTLNPETSLEALRDYAADVDMIQIMSVDPGFTGQLLVDDTYERIAQVKQLYPHAAIAIDGGVRLNNARKLLAAGADCLIASRKGFEQKGDLRAGITAWNELTKNAD